MKEKLSHIKHKLKGIFGILQRIPRLGWFGILMVIVLLLYSNKEIILAQFIKEEPTVKTVSENYITKKGNIRVSVPQEGTVYWDKYDLSFKSNGVVKNINIGLGSEVKKGELLASVDSTDLSIQNQQNQNNYTSSKLDLDLLKGSEYQAKKDAYEQAKQVYDMEKQINAAQLKILEEEFAKEVDNNEIEFDKTKFEEDNKVANSSDPDYQETLSDYLIDIASNNYEYTDNTWALEKLVQQNQLSESLLKAADSLESAELALKQHENSISKSELSLQNSSKTLTLSSEKVTDTNLYAPVNGIVVAVNGKVGEESTSGFIQILDTSSVYFKVYVEDVEFYQLTKGMKAEVTFENLSDPYQGEVTFISPAATTDNSGSNTYEVIVKFDKADSNVLDGLIGDINFIVKGVDNVLVIPNQYVYRENGESYVDVVNSDGTKTKTKVELGFSDGTNVEVKSGLDENVQLVTTKKVSNNGKKSN